MKIHHRWARSALFVIALGISSVANAAPVSAISATLGVEAFAINNAIQPGISRNTTGSGPISDAVSELSGLNTADSAASVNAAGLHASSAVHGDATNAGYSAFARSSAGLVNPFMLVPQAGFVGTQALVRIPYSFGGSINIFPSIQGCPTCFGGVQASLGVDGMTDQFYFLGASSLGTINNPTFFAGGVSRSGVLQGMLPVNTELYLRAGLSTNVHCQSGALSCGAEALFGSTLSYTGFSPDAVNIVWGLTPTVVPVPAAVWLLGSGLLGLIGVARRRRAS